MSEIDEILNQVPMDQVAAALGVDQSEAEAATRTAIPALLGGMQANAADPAGAASLMSAVEQHDPSVLGSGLDQIDTQDGERIVQNVFGEQTPDVMARLNKTVRRVDTLLAAKGETVDELLENLRSVSEDLRYLTQAVEKYPSQVLFGEPPPRTQAVKR